MIRPITLFTGQWGDLPLAELAPFAASCGYDGLELACWGDHVDVRRALDEPRYARDRLALLAQHSLRCWAISNHLVGQAVCDEIDERHRAILPAHVWGDGTPEGVRARAAEEMIATLHAAKRLGVRVVNGFTGSSIWGKFYFFPPTPASTIDRGYADFARRWRPILDQAHTLGVRFALEVHPGEIAYDPATARRAIQALDDHPAFAFNFDPSHLLWQGVDPAGFIDEFPDRIAHVHMKDVAIRADARASILGSHLPFGERARAWDFRSVGRGQVDFESIARALDAARYGGPLSVEWEDPGMDRRHGARESREFVARLQFPPAGGAFDSAFERPPGKRRGRARAQGPSGRRGKR